MITVYETLRVCRSAAAPGPCPLLARHTDDNAGHGHCGSRPGRIRPERGINPAQRPLLVSGPGLGDGHGLALLRHYDRRHGRAEAWTESSGAGAGDIYLRRPGQAFAPDAARA